MTTEPIPDTNQDRPRILGTAKVASSGLFPKYPPRECENLVRLAIEEVTGKPWHTFLMDPGICFESNQFSHFQSIIEQLQRQVPIQYILGKAWFGGLVFSVGPGVLIPRPETEELVEWSLEIIREKQDPHILDVCTGSGCIPLTLKNYRHDARVKGIEISSEALRFARLNGQNLSLEVEWMQSDLFEIPKDRFRDLDLITCNPPYIPESEKQEMTVQVVEHEPNMALFVPDPTPVLFYEELALRAMEWLKPDSSLLVEIHEGFALQVKMCFESAGMDRVEIRKDLQGKDRMVKGQRPSQPLG
jgi:release factor glutamine methyltransferase